MHLQSMPALTKLASLGEDRTLYGAVTAKQGESLKLMELISGNIERADSDFEKRAYMMQLISVRFCCWTGGLLKQVPTRRIPQAPSTRL